jgi:hypothetical protein
MQFSVKDKWNTTTMHIGKPNSVMYAIVSLIKFKTGKDVQFKREIDTFTIYYNNELYSTYSIDVINNEVDRFVKDINALAEGVIVIKKVE